MTLKEANQKLTEKQMSLKDNLAECEKTVKYPSLNLSGELKKHFKAKYGLDCVGELIMPEPKKEIPLTSLLTKKGLDK